MAKRSTVKRVSQRSYDDDDFNDDEMTEEIEDEEEDFEDDYDSDDEDDEDDEYDDDEDRHSRHSRKKSGARKHLVESAPNKEVRLKAFWSVYSQSYQRVETYDYADKAKAEARAAELTETKKMLHFVKLDKKVIES